MTDAMLTLDVEDWDHANFAQLDGRGQEIAGEVRRRRYRMERNTDRWIELLATRGARSTCFVLGEFANRYPEAIRRLSAAGHEIACHGLSHDLVYRMDRASFRQFLKRGIGTVGDVTGRQPIGFRAPSWSVDHRTPWFCQELHDAGIRYDSSVFPVKTPLFGQSGGPLAPFTECGVLRIPVTVLSACGLRLPFASGAFFRLSPLCLIRYGLAAASRQERPVMIVLHPRELDPGHPRLPLKGWQRWVHYTRLDSTQPKLGALLDEYHWVSIAEAFRDRLTAP